MPNTRIATQRFRDVAMVPLESVFHTCTYCDSACSRSSDTVLCNMFSLFCLHYALLVSRWGKPHFHFQNDRCPKCGIFNAWSDGKDDACHVLPRKKTDLITLLTGAAVVVILTFLAFEILYAPLMILGAKTDLADPAQADSKRTFMLSVQGPIVDLHKNLSRLVHQRVRYRAKGTGLIWLDYDQKKSNAIRVRNIARRKLLLQDTNPPFDCASCKGSLHATDFCYLLGLLTACISVTAMLPVIIKVAVTSGNGVGHVFAALACKELFWHTPKEYVLFCESKCCFELCLLLRWERNAWQRLQPFMWPFLWLLLLHCCICQWHGWSNGNIAERHFRRLWMSTGN